MPKELVMYSRTAGCPFVSLAKRVLSEHKVPYREVFIDRDPQARDRVLEWTGYQSVPTLVVAAAGDVLPIEEPAPIDTTKSPRGIDRGPMITEPNISQLIQWLTQHEFIESQQIAGKA